jgi:hypothetical protein
MVLSDNAATRHLFGNVAVLAGATAGEIGAALRAARQQFEELCIAVPAEKTRFEHQWASDAEILGQRIR